MIYRRVMFTGFDGGFPTAMKEKYAAVSSVIFKKSLFGKGAKCIRGYNSENEKYSLSNGEAVCFPYRLLYADDDDGFYNKLPDIESKLIYDCIFTRSSDGYVREKHLRNILSAEIPEWCLPYVLRCASDYVVEIVTAVYDNLKERDNADIHSFCRSNPEMTKRAYTRMVSYWNEFYRYDCYRFYDYVGQKLFKECILPGVNFEKLK